MTNVNAFEERPPVIPVRPWSFALWFLLPAWALLWFAANPPHAVDMALARPFFSDGAWPWHASAALETWFHFAPKVLSILFGVGVAAAAVYACGAARRARDRGNALEVRLWRERFTRLVALVGASLLCVTAVWWLKASTGVACPREAASACCRRTSCSATTGPGSPASCSPSRSSSGASRASRA